MISTIITHHRLWLAGHIMQDAKQLHPKEAVSVSPTWRTSVPLTSHGKKPKIWPLTALAGELSSPSMLPSVGEEDAYCRHFHRLFFLTFH